MSIYKEASRIKLLFPIRGNVRVEDLWRIPLTELNDLYMKITEELGKVNAGSLLESARKPDPVMQLQADILKDVVLTRQTENKAASERRELEAQIEALDDLQKDAEARALQSKTPEELAVMKAELRAKLKAL